MNPWHPTPKQAQQFEKGGYFIQRNVIPRDVAIELRGVIKNTILLERASQTLVMNSFCWVKDRLEFREESRTITLEIYHSQELITNYQ